MVFTFQPPFFAGLSGYCAELGASFIGAIVGFKVEDIFEAAREAQNAADYLLAMMTDQAD